MVSIWLLCTSVPPSLTPCLLVFSIISLLSLHPRSLARSLAHSLAAPLSICPSLPPSLTPCLLVFSIISLLSLHPHSRAHSLSHSCMCTCQSSILCVCALVCMRRYHGHLILQNKSQGLIFFSAKLNACTVVGK